MTLLLGSTNYEFNHLHLRTYPNVRSVSSFIFCNFVRFLFSAEQYWLACVPTATDHVGYIEALCVVVNITMAYYVFERWQSYIH